MTDMHTRLIDAAAKVEPSGRELERVKSLARRRRISRQVTTMSVAALLGGLGFLLVVRALPTGDAPTPATTSPTGTIVFLKSDPKQIAFGHDTFLYANPTVVSLDLETRSASHLAEGAQQVQSAVISLDGSRVAFSIGRLRSGVARWATYVVEADGNPRRVFDCRSPGCQTFPFAWSPNGQELAVYSNDSMRGEIWIVSADGQSKRPLVETGSYFGGGAWSPDGRTIALSGGGFGHPSIVLVDALTGAMDREISMTDVKLVTGLSWSPNGRTLALSGQTDAESASIFTFRLANGDIHQVTNCERCKDLGPAWSPDGRFIAFTRGSDWASDLFVVNVDGESTTRLSSTETIECCPSWAAGSVEGFASLAEVSR